MTDASEPEHAIFLLPLDDDDPGPLRRWLGREMWLKSPAVSLRYDPGNDGIMFRLIDTPSTSSGFLAADYPPAPGADLFIGFDGTDADAWLTMVTLIGFGRHADRGSSQSGIARDLVGDEAWEAALALRRADEVERTMAISADAAARLIRRWGELVVAVDDEALAAALAEWSGPAREAEQGDVTASHAAVAAALVAAEATSYAQEPRRSPGLGTRHAEARFVESGATGAGAAMARRSPSVLDGEPLGPIRYGLFARLADIWAARRDGRAGVPPLPASPPDPAGPHVVTPYMEIRHRHFLDWAERERGRMHVELQDTRERLATIQGKVESAEERAKEARKRLDALSAEQPDLTRRNVVEQNAHESLVRARRLREHTAQLIRLAKQEQDALQEASELREQEASLGAAIETRNQLLDSRVRQLWHHSLRRCGTYIRHIVHHHPDGNAVIPYLEMARPALPDWLPSARPDGTGPNGQAGP